MSTEPAHPGSPPACAAAAPRTTRFAARQSMRWVGFYSGLVSPEAAERRRAEIISDLWEQQASLAPEGTSARRVALSIMGRTAAGMAADLSWVRVERTSARGRAGPRAVNVAGAIAGLASHWWWALGALPIALAYVLMARVIWNEPGRPYADQLLLVLPAATLLIVGSALRSSRPQASAALVIIGTLPAFIAWWQPGLLAAATLVMIGAVAELAHLTPAGATGRRVAIAATVVLVGAMLAPFALGFALVWVVLAAGALAALVLTARRPAPSPALP